LEWLIFVCLTRTNIYVFFGEKLDHYPMITTGENGQIYDLLYNGVFRNTLSLKHGLPAEHYNYNQSCQNFNACSEPRKLQCETSKK